MKLVTVSVTPKNKKLMVSLKDSVNWTSVARKAFSAELTKAGLKPEDYDPAYSKPLGAHHVPKAVKKTNKKAKKKRGRPKKRALGKGKTLLTKNLARP